MPYVSMLLGRLHVVRWSTPAMPDVDRILQEVVHAHKTVKDPLVGISIVPAEAEPPPDEVRAGMSRNMDALLKCSEYIYFVMLGSGFRHSIMRSVLAGLLLFGGKRGKIGVESDLDLAIDAASRRVGITAATIRKEALARGILEKPVFAQAPP